MNIKVIKDKVTAKTQEYMKQMKAEVPEQVVNPFNN
jgi:hypothetical protein